MSTEQTPFQALVVEETDDGFTRTVKTRTVKDLPDNELLVRVRYSSLNYKDALSASGNKGVTREYPHTPGIDAVGTVVQCADNAFAEGDEVIVTSYDLGMNTPGGFGQYIRVPSDWAVKLPEGLSMKEAMVLGTAGLTAGMSVLRLAEQVQPEQGTIAVSGATGGVGSLSVAILAKLGYQVCAISGKAAERDYLLESGAAEVLARDELAEQNRRPMLKGRFAGAVDTVGGPVLENLIKSMQPMGVVTCCGNVASGDLQLTVYPFILRGVSLIGIDSQNCPKAMRQTVWSKLAGPWKPDGLMDMYTEITLQDLGDAIERMLAGQSRGRVLLDLAA